MLIDLFICYYTWLLGMIPMLIVFAVSLVFHEVGHYIVAKREGIYIGWGFLPQPHIEMKRALSSRWKYLAGFLFSMIILPFWIVFFGLQTFWVFIILQIGAAGADFIMIIFYGRLKKKK